MGSARYLLCVLALSGAACSRGPSSLPVWSVAFSKDGKHLAAGRGVTNTDLGNARGEIGERRAEIRILQRPEQAFQLLVSLGAYGGARLIARGAADAGVEELIDFLLDRLDLNAGPQSCVDA